jgi:hypothetical protein
MLQAICVFVGVLSMEILAIEVFKMIKEYKRKDLNRNMNEDNMFAMADFAYELHELACEDLNIDPDISISIYDEGEASLGSTCINHERRIAYKIIVSPNQTVEQFVDTVLHETRHVYQSIVTPEAVFDRAYIRYDEEAIDKDAAFDAYASQDIEVDARTYANKAMKLYRRRINRMIKRYNKQLNK